MPRALLASAAWDAMTPHEAKLIMQMAKSYRGGNNGDIACVWKDMSQRGWVSKATLEKAKAGLIEKGLLTLTRQGGRRVCSLFALTWEPIDECGGKIDVKPSPVPSNAWERWRPPGDRIAPPDGSIAEKTLPHVVGQSAPRGGAMTDRDRPHCPT